MEKLVNDLLTSKYTSVFHEDKENIEFNAPHNFVVRPSIGYLKSIGNTDNPEDIMLSVVNFQKGPIKENGVNGVANEDLICMVLARLESFQKSEYKCLENEMAIQKLTESLLWLRKRTMGRENRGVEGTNEI